MSSCLRVCDVGGWVDIRNPKSEIRIGRVGGPVFFFFFFFFLKNIVSIYTGSHEHRKTDSRPPRGMWGAPSGSPIARRRSVIAYVDFLRALSILAVVLGHWLISAPYLNDGAPAYSHLLDLAPWSRWLTWIFQVMPVFFFVGGFSNGVSWGSARRKGLGYREWFDARARRLIGPVLPLIVMWGLMVAVAHANGVGPGMIFIGSKVALVPVWFLAVYILVVALVPLTYAAWQRWGFASVVFSVVMAALDRRGLFCRRSARPGLAQLPLRLACRAPARLRLARSAARGGGNGAADVLRRRTRARRPDPVGAVPAQPRGCAERCRSAIRCRQSCRCSRWPRLRLVWCSLSKRRRGAGWRDGSRGPQPS